MTSLRQWQGLSGYQKRNESPHDVFEAGHSSTALSGAMGLALGRDLNQDTYNVIAVVGDASLTSGMAMEALNHLGHFPHKVILIYNDNGMGISHPIGGISRVFSSARNSVTYQSSKKSIRISLSRSRMGRFIFRTGRNVKELTRRFFLGTNLFENMNLNYLGPFSGHRIANLVHALEIAKSSDQSTVVHVVTKKGKGYSYAEHDQTGEWHGVDPFSIETGKPLSKSPTDSLSWSQLMSQLVERMMMTDNRIVTITPAMITGAKLDNIFEHFPDRAFDVGIAEAHAVTFAAGLALQDKRPFVSIYSTFLQRAYDQINHDIGRMQLPVVFGVDRSGIVGKDGETHQGIFDVSFVKSIPNTIIAMPKDMDDAEQILRLAFSESNRATYIRYPRGRSKIMVAHGSTLSIQVGKWEYYANKQSELTLIITGPMFLIISQKVKELNLPVDLVFARYYKPLDETILNLIMEKNMPILVYDIYSTREGLFDSIQSFLMDHLWTGKMEPLVIPTNYLPQGDSEEILNHYHLDVDSLIAQVNHLLGRS